MKARNGWKTRMDVISRRQTYLREGYVKRSAVSIWILIVVIRRVYSEIQPRMYVVGNSLFDRCGRKVVLRGVNAMIVIRDPTGEISYPKIAKTGVNCVRIFWSTTTHPGNTLENFDATLTNCRENNMIPMPCVWGRWGGNWQYLQEAVDFRLRPEWVEVLRKHEDHILFNIANEVGNQTVTDSMFRERYEKAVLRLRNAGLHMPLVIDASGHGRDESLLFKSAEYLLEKDPDHNLIFSRHLYDHIPRSGKRERVEGALDTMAMMDNACFIVGEFSQCQSGSYDNEMEGCEKQKVEWEYLIERCQQEEIGRLAWVWWCCRGDGDLHSIVKWKKASSKPGLVDSNPFIAIWTGQVQAPFTAEYEFSTYTNDFSWLFVNGVELFKLYGPNKKGWEQGSILLEAGKKYNLGMAYREWDGPATAQLYWSCPDMSWRIIPKCRLFPDTGAIVATAPNSQLAVAQRMPRTIGRANVYDLTGRCITQIDASEYRNIAESGRIPHSVFIVRFENASGPEKGADAVRRAVFIEKQEHRANRRIFAENKGPNGQAPECLTTHRFCKKRLDVPGQPPTVAKIQN